MNFKYEDKPSLFKILRSNTIDYLPLPSAFAKKYLEKGTKKKQTIVLKTKPGGVIWRVKYLIIEDRYYFLDGWLKFVNDNRLKEMDFLVFWFLSPENSIFRVFCYAPNGCLKRPKNCSHRLRRPLVIANSGHDSDDGQKLLVKDETSDYDDNDSMENMQGTLTKVVRASYLKAMPLKNGFAGIDGQCKVNLKNDEGKTLEVDVRMWKYSRATWIPVMVNQWSDFVKDNELEVGDICEITHVQDNLLHVHVIKEKEICNLQEE